MKYKIQFLLITSIIKSDPQMLTLFFLKKNIYIFGKKFKLATVN